MKNRKAITLFDEDSAITLIKPYSDAYKDKVFVISEDAFGEIIGILTPINDIKFKYNLSDEEFNIIINSL